MKKYCWSSLGCRNFLMNLQAWFLVMTCYILEFLTRSIPIPNTFILAIYLDQGYCFIIIKIKTMEVENQALSVRNVKALLCQVKPFYKNKVATIERISVSLQKYSSKDRFDIIAFPQMAFAGYNFSDPADALPYSVKQNSGIDFQFASNLAQRLKAYVAFGYIEAVEDKSNQFTLYNSAAVIDREGKMIANYRKSHLYYNDKLWAKQGSKFVLFDLQTLEKKTLTCVLGICMDINPKDFASAQFQLADFMVKTKADVLVFLTNWVDSEKDNIHSNDIAATYKYWLHRLTPVLLSKKCTLMLIADRAGKEFDYFAKKETMFYGSSAAIMLNPHKILSNLDIQNQGYLVIQTFLP